MERTRCSHYLPPIIGSCSPTQTCAHEPAIERDRGRMPDANQLAAAINFRVRQLEAQGITGIALANHMIGHMQDLNRIYNTASDRTLCDLCRRFPGFERYARLMEEVSKQN